MSWKKYFRRAQWDAERARELQTYLQIETDDNIARGLPPQDNENRCSLRRPSQARQSNQSP
jgi:hypothetical protein